MAVGASLFNVDKTCKKDSDHDKRFVRERRVHTRLAALTDGDARRLRHGALRSRGYSAPDNPEVEERRR